MGSRQSSRARVEKRIPWRVLALKKYFADQTLVLEGKQVTTASMIAEMQSFQALLLSIDNTRAQLAALIGQAFTQQAAILARMRDVNSYVRVMYGNSHQVLAAFGLKMRKPRKLSTPVKAAAAAKAKATRQARGTMSRMQKAKIHGTPPPAKPAK